MTHDTVHDTDLGLAHAPWAGHVPNAASSPQTTPPSTEAAALVPAPDPASHAADTHTDQPRTTTPDLPTERTQAPLVPAHHPAVQLMLDQALHGDTPTAKNLAVLVGTIQIDTNKDGKQRQMTTAIGDRQLRYYLAITEELASATSASRATYRLQLTISRSLVDRYADLLHDGQRIQLFGTITREQQYDRRLAQDADDPGDRTWALQFDVLALHAAPAGCPDYAYIVLEGEIEHDPIPRRQTLDRGAYTYSASVLLRNRLQVQSAAPGSRATFPVTYLLPLQVSLDDPPAQVAALLTRGCTVRVEGRLLPYVIRRNPTYNPRLQAAMAQRKEHWQKEQLRQQRDWTIQVGYVELLRGTPRDVAAIAALREDADSRANQRRPVVDVTPAATDPTPDPTVATTALDAATQAALAEVMPEPITTPTESTRPRRRTTARSTTADAAPAEAADDGA